jgi:predicted SnoaL-like aldol condensation-catalyzing enzyme
VTDDPRNGSDGAEAARKQAVMTLYADLLGRGRGDFGLIARDYVPHVPVFATGMTPGREAFIERLRASGPVANEVRRIIADEDWVFAHVKYPGSVTVAGADIFRFDQEDRIAAHWNVRQPLAGQSRGDVEERFASAREAAPAKPWERGRLKQRVRSMVGELWAKGDASLVPHYYSQGYVQHNVDMPGGYARIREVVEKDIRGYIRATGHDFPVELHHIGAEGDLVFAHLSLFMAGINRNDGDRSTNVDIFRIDEAGRMTEHWDVLQMSREELPDGSSLF